MGDLRARDLGPGSGFEITVVGDEIRAMFYYDWGDRGTFYDGAGAGDTVSEAARAAVADAERD